MHFPAFALSSSGLRRLGSLLRVAVNTGKRIVPENDPQSGGNILLQIAKNHIQAPAIRALVIAILDECMGCVLWTVYVVYGTYWKQQTGQVWGVHIGYWCRHTAIDA